MATARLAQSSSPAMGFTTSLVPGSSALQVNRVLERGLSYAKAERLRKRADLPVAEYCEIVGYSMPHYKRLVRTRGQLQKAAANRLYRFAQILERAVALYDGNEAHALQWLKHANPAFDGQAPIKMLSSEIGSNVVAELITQLELGILPA